MDYLSRNKLCEEGLGIFRLPEGIILFISNV